MVYSVQTSKVLTLGKIILSLYFTGKKWTHPLQSNLQDKSSFCFSKCSGSTDLTVHHFKVIIELFISQNIIHYFCFLKFGSLDYEAKDADSQIFFLQICSCFILTLRKIKLTRFEILVKVFKFNSRFQFHLGFQDKTCKCSLHTSNTKKER